MTKMEFRIYYYYYYYLLLMLSLWCICLRLSSYWKERLFDNLTL